MFLRIKLRTLISDELNWELKYFSGMKLGIYIKKKIQIWAVPHVELDKDKGSGHNSRWWVVQLEGVDRDDSDG